MGLPTEPIQRLELGFECFDRFNCAVGPFGLDRPVASTLYYEKYRFSLKLAQGAHFMRATGFAFGNCILSLKEPPLNLTMDPNRVDGYFLDCGSAQTAKAVWNLPVASGSEYKAEKRSCFSVR